MKKIISTVIFIILAVIKLNAQCDITGTLNVCVGSTTQLNAPGTVVSWVSSAPEIATVSSTGLVTGMSAGTSEITYTNSDPCSSTAIITVTAPVVPTFAALGPYCVGDTPGELSTTSTNGITGTWSPSSISTATAGTITYTFTPAAGLCATNTTRDIIVNPNVTPIFTALGPYCVGDTPDILPAISLNGITGSWSPAAISTASAGILRFILSPQLPDMCVLHRLI